MGKGKFSRDKGKRGEREVVNLLQPVVTRVCQKIGIEEIVLERNLMQSHRGGYDIVGLDWLALEVKFCETIQLDKWWKQTLEQAGGNKEPVLFYRKSRAKWLVATLVSISPAKRVRGIITLEDYLDYFEQRLTYTLIQ